ncbi:MAG: RcnB family protein [Rhizomicrobium sp.]
MIWVNLVLVRSLMLVKLGDQIAIKERIMKRVIIPALSVLLLAGLPAQAQSIHLHSFQIAQNSRGGGQSGADAARNDHGRGDKNKPAERATRGGHAAGGGASTFGARSPAMTGGSRAGRAAGTGGGAAVSGTPAGRAAKGGRAAGGGASTFGAGSPAMTGGSRAGRAAGTRGPETIGGAGAVVQAPAGTGMGRAHAGGAAVLGGGKPAATVYGTRPPNWNNYPRQFDRQVYQRNITASRRYHWHSYNRPSGWYYQRWVFGQIFPSIFWARDYWITDYWMFDLPIPPYGYVWVRYGDDALLINRRTGTVLQVVYGVFY